MAGELQVGPHTFDSLAAAEAVMDFSDPLGTGLQTNNTARRWCWHNADTTSSNVGPTSGAGGSPDGYVYTEASSPAVSGDSFEMQLAATVDCEANENVTVNFKTNQRGTSNDATCQLQTNENGAGWVNRGALFGGSGDPDKVATSGTQIWSQRSVDISALGVSHASTAIRIVVVIATNWNADYGLDEFEVVGDLVATSIIEQEGFRFRDDDGNEATANWSQLQDVDDTIGQEENFRLRILLDATDDPDSQQFTIEYKETSDAASEWRAVPLT